MMDNKLSELSKPVGFVSKQAQALLKSGDTASVRPFFDVQGSSPLYSQEYVSALRADAAKWFEAFKKTVSVGARYEERIAELEAKLATPVRLPDIEFVKISGIDFPVMRADIVKKEIRHAGFKVEGDDA